MDQLLQHCLNALILGGTYALLGIGLTLIFGIMRVVNFTHGELYAFGAYMMYMWVMVLGAELLPRAAAGGAARRRARRGDRARAAAPAARRRHRHHHAGDDRRLDRAAERRAARLVAASPSRSTRRFPSAPLVLGPVSVSWNRLFVFVVALALIAATYALINRTRLGKAMRATFQDRETAALMGVEIGRIHTATFALGSGLAAAAGALLGPGVRRLSDHGRPRLAQGLRHRHPRRPRQHPRRHHRRLHPGLHGGAGRRLHLLGLSATPWASCSSSSSCSSSRPGCSRRRSASGEARR